MSEPRILSSADRFKELLSEFRNFQVQLGDQQVQIVIYTNSSWRPENQPWDREKMAIICDVLVPCDLDRKHFTQECSAFICGFGESNKPIVGTKRPYYWNPESEEFKKIRDLFRRAAVALPAEYSTFLSDAEYIFSGEPSRQWVDLLVFMRGLVVYQGVGKRFRQPKLLIERALLASCQCIELLRLDTDAPYSIKEIQKKRLLDLTQVPAQSEPATSLLKDQERNEARDSDTPANADPQDSVEQSQRKKAEPEVKRKRDNQLKDLNDRVLSDADIEKIHTTWKSKVPRRGVIALLKERHRLSDEVAKTLADRFRTRESRINNAKRK